MKRRKMTALLVILCVLLAIGGGLFQEEVFSALEEYNLLGKYQL